jgi:lipopolysaccharide transport system ATP-binding protein
MDEVVVFHHGAFVSNDKDSKRTTYKVTGKLPPNFLNAGNYRFNLIFGENQRFGLYSKNDVIQFEITNETLGTNSKTLPGVVRPEIAYEIVNL